MVTGCEGDGFYRFASNPLAGVTLSEETSGFSEERLHDKIPTRHILLGTTNNCSLNCRLNNSQ